MSDDSPLGWNLADGSTGDDGVPTVGHNHGDAGAMRNYASRLRDAARRLQDISGGADSDVSGAAASWEGAWKDGLLKLWNMQVTGDTGAFGAAWHADRRAFERSNPHGVWADYEAPS